MLRKETKGQTFLVSGNSVKFSNFVNDVKPEHSDIIVVGFQDITIDTSFQESSKNLTIVSPNCKLEGAKQINLSGANGAQQANANGTNGTSGGNFYAKFDNFHGNFADLTIISNGGDGGNGASGEDAKLIKAGEDGGPGKNHLPVMKSTVLKKVATIQKDNSWGAMCDAKGYWHTFPGGAPIVKHDNINAKKGGDGGRAGTVNNKIFTVITNQGKSGFGGERGKGGDFAYGKDHQKFWVDRYGEGNAMLNVGWVEGGHYAEAKHDVKLVTKYIKIDRGDVGANGTLADPIKPMDESSIISNAKNALKNADVDPDVKKAFKFFIGDFSSIFDEQLDLVWQEIENSKKYDQQTIVKLKDQVNKIAIQAPSLKELLAAIVDLKAHNESNEELILQLFDSLAKANHIEENQLKACVAKVVYDNKLLNHAQFLNEAIELYGFDKTVEMSAKFSPSLAEEIIINNDYHLALAGFMSLMNI